jgi:cytochrome c oxidase subunit 3
MLSARPTAHAENKLVSHFSTLEQQSHAAKLGMWIFLSTEVLLFGGLFVGYAYYRSLYHDAFAQGSHHLNVFIGTLNTLVLIASSFFVALSSYFTHHERRRACVVMLALAVVLGLVFLVLKGDEWRHHFEEGAYPGRYYAFSEVQVPGASLFFTFYFLMTGLHAFHVTVGIGVLVWVSVLAARGSFSRFYDTPLELSTMYWHLVDIVWIFLYPLLYLI